MTPNAIVESRLWIAAGWTMIHFLWVGAVIWLVAAGVRRAARRAAPAARYALALAMFGLLAGAPLAIFPLVPPTPRVAASAVAPRGGANLPREGKSHAPGRLADTPPERSDLASKDRSRLQEFPPPAAKRRANRPAPRTVDLGEAAFAWREEARRLASASAKRLPWLWLVGSPLVFLTLATGLVGVERLREGSRRLAADEFVARECRRLTEKLKMARRVWVAVSDRVTSPLLLGIVRPLIVLPPAVLAGCTPQQVEMILLHELAHARRWDNLVNLIQRIVESILFFHPAVWQLSSWIRLEREHCCDAIVLSATRDPRGYAETLASWALPGMSPGKAVAAMAHHHLVDRIRHILDLEDRSMRISRAFLASTVAVGVMASWLAIGFAQQEPEKIAVTEGAKTATPPGTTEGAYDQAKVLIYSGQTSSPEVGEGRVLVQKYLADSSERVYESRPRHGRPWGPEQAIGPPDTTEHGDQNTAWASLTPDGQDEWLSLQYAKPVSAVAVVVFESYNPGAMTEIQISLDKDPIRTLRPTVVGDTSLPTVHVVVTPVGAAEVVNHVSIKVASSNVQGWNEIDAVGLLDSFGVMHWASGATASSTYADQANVAWGEPMGGPPTAGATTERFEPVKEYGLYKSSTTQNSGDGDPAVQYRTVNPESESERVRRLEMELIELHRAIDKLQEALKIAPPGAPPSDPNSSTSSNTGSPPQDDLATPLNSNSLVYDRDNDGDLDLHLANYNYVKRVTGAPASAGYDASAVEYFSNKSDSDSASDVDSLRNLELELRRAEDDLKQAEMAREKVLRRFKVMQARLEEIRRGLGIDPDANSSREGRESVQ